jgi:hypothetical protein
MTDKEFQEVLMTATRKYGRNITARLDVEFVTESFVETYLELHADEDGFVFDEDGFVEYLSECLVDYLYEIPRSELAGIKMLTEDGEEI